MFEVNIKGFKTQAQADAFVSWYSGAGEQDADLWFEIRQEEGEIDVDSMHIKDIETKWEGNVLNMTVDPM